MSLGLEIYATDKIPPLPPETSNTDEQQLVLVLPSFQNSYVELSHPKTDVIPSITVTSCEQEKQLLIPSPSEDTLSPIVKAVPETIASPRLRGTYLPPPATEETPSSLTVLCFHENCLDDPYEDIFLPSLPPKAHTPPIIRDFLPSLKPQGPVTSMIEVEHGLSTSHIIIDGNKQPPFGYNLLSDIFNVFKEFYLEDASTRKALCWMPSIRARNLSSRDTLSLFTALDTILAEQNESDQEANSISPEKCVVAIYLYNVEIDVNSAQILQGIMEQNKYLQNLWLEYCKIDENAENIILAGITPSLRSFWLLDDKTDFRMPPPL